MEKNHSIKRGVSLYSFQEEYFLRKMTLEDCIAKCGDLGQGESKSSVNKWFLVSQVNR